MSETVRIKNPEGGWMVVKFVAFGEVKGESGETKAKGILVELEENTLPTGVSYEHVHPDDYDRLVKRYSRK